MCGIVGVVGNDKAVGIVLEGLKRLEYRGYDSAGVAVLDVAGVLSVCKAAGKLAVLDGKIPAFLEGLGFVPRVCFGHTRWATHGGPSDTNAHPHVSTADFGPRVAVVHNGILENYQHLRTRLGAEGAVFATETDTETFPFLVASHVKRGAAPAEAVRLAAAECVGSFAIAAAVEGTPNTLFATRRGAPLCVGLGDGAMYLASDALALAGVCSHFIYLHDGDVAVLTPESVRIVTADGAPVERPAVMLDLSAEASGKAGYKHFMLKEIHEQPAVAGRILEAYTDAATHLPVLDLKLPTDMPHVNIVACGTAYYAGLVGKYMIESLARVPVNVDVASEFRYRQPAYRPGGVFIAVSQSGETADTLAALEHAKAAGQHIIALTNVTTSSIARAAHVVVDLKAGREVAVASTKAFSAMCLVLTLVALQMAEQAGALTREALAVHGAELRLLPMTLTTQLSAMEGLAEVAGHLASAKSMLYLGRGFLAPLALEGALKMKEITYIHAEGYASGEMKHGPIALVDETLPVVNLAAGNDGLFEKTLSNLREVEARKGQVILITDEAGVAQLDAETRARLTLISVPTVPPLLLPLVFAIPLQMLAYLTALAKGTDVDQPRNLAKSVTVE